MNTVQWICLIIILFFLWVLYVQNYQTILKKDLLKKLRVICKRECRNEGDQLVFIVKKFVEEYAQEQNITWE